MADYSLRTHKLTTTMYEPTLHYVTCSGAAAVGGKVRRLAYWEWNQAGDAVNGHVIVCVHGLTRQGRDFDMLARQLSVYARVICPDIAGRGYSDWLDEPLAYGLPQYVSDMEAMLSHINARASIDTLDWMGTSMGGLIGMVMAGSAAQNPQWSLSKLLLNDVGPALEWPALQRIASYVGKSGAFASVQEAVQTLRQLSVGFGPHTDAQWRSLNLPMLREQADGRWRLHYDPSVAQPMVGMTLDSVLHGQAWLWLLYDNIKAQTLLVRGEQSDLLSAATALQMQLRGPLAQYVALANVGHAPTFVTQEQIDIALNFFVGEA
jgi:pimeloyl-ACP methyl ester carboxylesterase